MTGSCREHHNKFIKDLRANGFNGLADKLESTDYKNAVTSVPDSTSIRNTSTKNETNSTMCKNEEAAALPPGCLLLPIEVI